jgi:hypothetical protein
VTGRAGRWNLDVRPRAQRQLARLPEKIATAAAGFLTGPLLENPYRAGHLLRDEYAGSTLPAGDLTGVFVTGSMRTLAPSSSWTFLIAPILTVRKRAGPPGAMTVCMGEIAGRGPQRFPSRWAGCSHRHARPER